MSLNQGSIAAHIPSQTLPSFAQAFSTSSLNSMPPGNGVSLPPINHPTNEFRRVKSPPSQPASRPPSEEASSSQMAGRKRTHEESSTNTNDEERPRSGSPSHATNIKQEPDQDPHFSGPHNNNSDAPDDMSAPAPSSVNPSASKKRRVTVTGAPVLNTDVKAPAEPGNSTPISPVVIGFTIQRDNPSAVEAVRSMLSVKQKQKALIEQRRGSAAGIVSPPSAASGQGEDRSASVPNVRAGTSNNSARSSRRSPNAGASTRRQTVGGNTRPPSPSPVVAAQQSTSTSHPTSTNSAHSLPPPPISFARRRATQLGAVGKKKPADIIISPREDHTPEQLALSIQSAPPVPLAPGTFYPGRFQMSLPRLPSVMGGSDPIRRTVGGNVPPTPTRLATQGGQNQGIKPIPAIAGIGRSPPTASVAISSSHVPPTPSSLHHPGYAGDKSAFLAPFEMFYDALNDSKQLKNWLSEQLQRSNTLIQNLTQQQDKMHEYVESLIEKRMAPIKVEMAGMRRRIDELEDALRQANAAGGGVKQTETPKGKQPLRNGGPPTAPLESYTFPPVERLRPEPERLERMRASPGWGEPHNPETESGSPAPYASRRLSLSASRLDPPRPHNGERESSHLRGPGQSSPPSTFREALPPPPSSGKMRSFHPGLPRQTSNSRIPTIQNQSEREREIMASPPPSIRREEGRRSRRNSIDEREK